MYIFGLAVEVFLLPSKVYNIPYKCYKKLDRQLDKGGKGPLAYRFTQNLIKRGIPLAIYPFTTIASILLFPLSLMVASFFVFVGGVCMLFLLWMMGSAM